MKVVFWGTRGSLPYSMRSEKIALKIRRALDAAIRAGLDSEDQVDDFIAGLDFSIRGSYGCNTSCVEIRGGDEILVCDAGTGLRDFGKQLMEIRSGEALTVHLLISHMHHDHIQGFPFFLPAFVPGNTVHIYGCHEAMESAFVRQQEPPFFPLTLEELGADIQFHVLDVADTPSIAGFDVSIIKQNHPGDSYGYRIERDGQACVYSTDSEHLHSAYEADYPFLDFFRDADLLIFDGQYDLADHFMTKQSWGHSSNMMGVELAVRSGAKRLSLFHNEHTLDDRALEQFLRDTRKYLTIFNAKAELVIDVAYDGLEIDLASDEKG